MRLNGLAFGWISDGVQANPGICFNANRAPLDKVLVFQD